MKIIKKRIEKYFVSLSEKEETEIISIFEKRNIHIEKNEKISGEEIYKNVIESLANRKYDLLIADDLKNYLKLSYRYLKTSKVYYRTITRTNMDVVIEKLKMDGKEKYLHLPENEQESTWYQDWYGSENFQWLQNRSFDAIMNGVFKKISNHDKTPTLVISEYLQQIFPCDKIYVCEELKIIFLIDMHPFYGEKGVKDGIYTDYENSPLLKTNIKHYYPYTDKYRKKSLEELMYKNGLDGMNQESLLKLVENKKNINKLEILWYTSGRRFCNSPQNLQGMIEELENQKLSKILSTYIISPIDYIYTPFVIEIPQLSAEFLWGAGGCECIYGREHLIKVMPEKLEERLNAEGYITEYFTEKCQHYDYMSTNNNLK